MPCGSLGGYEWAIGAAWPQKTDNDKNIVYFLTGDGELDEGQNWDALMFQRRKCGQAY